MAGGARLAGLAALLAALASCAVDVEGAPCSTAANCPSGQGCGLDGRCSARALTCVACRPGEARCRDGRRLETCESADGVCADWAVHGCGDSQACQATDGGATCVCVAEPDVCQGEGDVCDASGQLVSCGRDRSGCLTTVAQVACKEHQSCAGGACACDATPAACAGQVGASCTPDRSAVVTCPTTVEGCTWLASTTTCPARQQCTGGAPDAACSCVPAPAVCAGQVGTACTADLKAVATCDASRDGCVDVASPTRCPAHQACAGTAPTARCACIPEPACSQGAGAFCDGTAAVTCDVEGGCTVLVSKVTCGGPHQVCKAVAGTAGCACQDPGACTRAGALCSADRTAVLSCAQDADRCLFADAPPTTCPAGQICGDASACAPTYEVAVTAPAAGTVVGPGGVTVTVVVRPATGEVAFAPAPPSVDLLVDGRKVIALPRVGSGTPFTYEDTWTPAAASDGAASLSARVSDAAGHVFASAEVSVAADTAPPVIQDVTLGCGAPSCVRDAPLQITAEVTDSHPVSAVKAILDGDASHPVALSKVGPTWQATVNPSDWSFRHFAARITAAVSASDAIGNQAAPQTSPPLDVTRLRWKYAAGAPVTAPAVLADGTLVLATAGSSNQVQAVAPLDGSRLWQLTLGSQGASHAPSAGALVWVGADDGTLYAVRPGPSPTIAVTCPGSGGAAVFTPAVDPAAVPEVAHAGTSGGELLSAQPPGATPRCNVAALTTSQLATSSPVQIGTALALATAANTLHAELARFAIGSTNPTILSPTWQAGTVSIEVPLARLLTGEALAATSGGELKRFDLAASSAPVTPTFFTLATASPAGSPVVAGGAGDVFLPGSDRRIHRITVPSAGTSVDLWSGGPTLPSTPRGLALLVPDARTGAFLVATVSDPAASDEVVAIAESGGLPTVAWASSGLASGLLTFPVVAPPPPGAALTALPTLYVGSGDGNLYAVVVDTPLDASSPWPKAHHDLRNTGNAASPLP